MNLLNVDSLNKDMLNKLYQFLIKPNNFLNKQNISNIIWNIIYLHKILGKSIRSKRSKKEQINFNYIITNANSKHNEIICFFTFHIPKEINSKSDIPLLLNFIELSVIIDLKYNFTDIFHIIINQYQKLCEELVVNNQELHASNILCIYIPLEKVDINNALVDCQFELALKNNSTFRKEYFIYYKFYESISSLKNKDYKKQRNNKITSGDIIGYIMNYYGLNKVLSIQPDKIMTSASSKLTRKSVPFGEIKIITRNIMDIKELQDLPEYDYDFIKVYSLKYLTLINYVLNKSEIKNTRDFIIKRFFPGSLQQNNNLIQLYMAIIKNLNDTYNCENINSKYLNINNILENKVNQKISYFIRDNLIKKIIPDSNSKLILTNNFKTIENFKLFKNIYVVYLKQQVVNAETAQKELNEKINKENQLVHNVRYQSNFKNLNIILSKNNKRYDVILLELKYANYDILIGNINLILKSQFIINTIFNALFYLNIGGEIILLLEYGYLDIPIFRKIFTILLDLFETYEIISSAFPEDNLIIFKKFRKPNKQQIYICKKLIELTIQEENNETKLNDIIHLLLLNKFTYKLNENIKELFDESNNINSNKTYNILYDIKGLNLTENNKLNNFFKDYTKAQKINTDYYNQLIRNFFDNNNLVDKTFSSAKHNINKLHYNKDISQNDECAKLVRFIENKYKYIFKFVSDYKLFETNIVF